MDLFNLKNYIFVFFILAQEISPKDSLFNYILCLLYINNNAILKYNYVL